MQIHLLALAQVCRSSRKLIHQTDKGQSASLPMGVRDCQIVPIPGSSSLGNKLLITCSSL